MRWKSTSTMVRIHSYTHDRSHRQCLLMFMARPAESASDIEVDGFGDDFKVGRSDRKVYDVEHTSLSQHEIEKIMQTDVDHISGIFGVEVRLQTRVCL